MNKQTPQEIAKRWFGIDLPSHITFNPDLTKESGAQYEIIRGATHDGLIYASMLLYNDVFIGLFNKSSYCKLDDMEGVTDISYEIGFVHKETTYISKKEGFPLYQTDIIKVPVKCHLIKN